MAAIGKIRQHGVLLICIVGFAMLAFILTSSIDDMSGLFRGNQTKVAEIEGVELDIQEYEKQVERFTEVYKMESGRELDDETSSALREQVWQMLLTDYTLRKQAEKIGLHVTNEELAALCFGENAHQFITQRFGSGQVALSNYNYAFNQELEDEQMAPQIDQFKRYWEYCENVVRINRMQEKYSALLLQCVTANSLDAKFAFENSKKSAEVAYVLKPYFSVQDEITVSDSEIKAAYNKQKEQYRLQKPTRSIEYITFDLKPSQQDNEDVKAKVEALMEEFATTDDVLTVVNLNSDVTYEGRNYSEATIPAEWKEFAFGSDAKAGNVSELIFANNMYQVARIMEAGYSLPDSIQIKAIAKEEGQEDQELGWFTEDALAKDLADKAFACKKGESFTMGTGDAAQTFVVTDAAPATPKVKVAILARELFVSDRTKGLIYSQAMQYIIDNTTREAFEAAADSLGYTIRPASGLNDVTPRVADLKSSRDIVRWAFGAKEGQVSQEAYLCDDKYVVVACTGVQEGKYLEYTDPAVNGYIRMQVLNDKKAAAIKEQLAGVTTLEAAAEKLGAEVQVAEGVTFASARFGKEGNEPAVVGAAAKLAEGQISAPIQGQAGVYVLKLVTEDVAEAEFNKDAQIQQLNMYTSYMLPRQASDLISRKAEVEDNRAKFF